MENYAKVKLRPSTFKTSQGFLKNHIKPQIGSIQLADLTSLDLQRFYKHLLDGGRVDRIEAKKKPKGLAPKTVRNIHQMIGCLSRRQDPPWNLCPRQFVSSRMRERKKCCWWMKLTTKNFLQSCLRSCTMNCHRQNERTTECGRNYIHGKGKAKLAALKE